MLYKKIKDFKKKKPQLFCTPGHKGKMPRCFSAGLDITELNGTDNLYKPEGIIKEAEERAAKIFGARELLFLTSGATQGIFAMLGAFKGKRVMIPRGSHKSIFEACQFFNIEPVFENILPQENGGLADKDEFSAENIIGDFVPEGEKSSKNTKENTDFSSGNNAENKNIIAATYNGKDIAHNKANNKSQNENEEISARLVIYPDYYGNAIDLKSVYEDCKQKGIYLLVDSAHGSHFGFSQHLPESAVKHSDLCVMSAHKTLPALTQGAYLAINNKAVAEDVKFVYRSLGTTSPSYPIMASLDYAACYLKTHGEKSFERLFAALQKFKAKLPHGVRVCESGDFTRLVLDLTDFGSNGFFAEGYFNKQKIYPEFSDFRRVVFILSICDKPSALRKISRALRIMKSEIFVTGGGICAEPVIPYPERTMSFLEAGNADRECIDVDAAEGRVAASEIGFYPPGIPLVIRGEILTKRICDIIKTHGRAGYTGLYENKLFGLSNGKLLVVK